jgi:hypothetical protein
VTDYERLIKTLDHAGVEFIVIGGFAATLHGSAQLTEDLDVVQVSLGRGASRQAKPGKGGRKMQ